jgi:hypothetical protein
MVSPSESWLAPRSKRRLPTSTDLGDRHLALPRVAEAHAHVGAYVETCVACPCHGRLEHGELLVEAAVEVALGEGLGGTAEDGDVAAAELERTVEATFVGDEHRQVLARVAETSIRSPASASWGTHLGCTKLVASTTGRPGRQQSPDELGLGLDRDDAALVLETVARADLVDRDALGQVVRDLVLVVTSETHESGAERDLLARLGADGGDRAGERRLERQLHLHRLQYAEPLSLLDSIPLRHVDREHGAGIGAVRLPSPTAARRRERVGALEDEALSLDHDLDRVRGRVDHRLHAAAGDLETDDVVARRRTG